MEENKQICSVCHKIIISNIENDWCDDCKKNNPQAYFYRKGGHKSD